MRRAEAFFQYSVQFFPDHFPAPAFHTAGLHDDGVFRQLYLVFFHEIQQGERYPQKKYFVLVFCQTEQLFPELFMLVEVKAAVRIAAGFDKSLCHSDQGRPVPFEIGRKQGQYGRPIDRPVVVVPRGGKTPAVSIEMPHEMPALAHAGRPAGKEYFFRLEMTGYHFFCLKEADRQERYLFHAVHFFRADAQHIHIFPVHRIFPGLVAERLQCHFLKSIPVVLF